MARSTSDCAPCPECSSTDAEKVTFTWWGGLLGPSLLHHVKCLECGATFNGKTGKSNAAAISIYVLASLVIGGVVLFGLFFLR